MCVCAYVCVCVRARACVCVSVCELFDLAHVFLISDILSLAPDICWHVKAEATKIVLVR